MIERIDTRSWVARGQDALSQFANWLLFNGDPDQTISARCHQNTVIRSQLGLPVKRRWRLVRAIAEALFWYSDRGEHCRRAWASDADRNARRAEAFRTLLGDNQP